MAAWEEAPIVEGGGTATAEPAWKSAPVVDAPAWSKAPAVEPSFDNTSPQSIGIANVARKGIDPTMTPAQAAEVTRGAMQRTGVPVMQDVAPPPAPYTGPQKAGVAINAAIGRGALGFGEAVNEAATGFLPDAIRPPAMDGYFDKSRQAREYLAEVEQRNIEGIENPVGRFAAGTAAMLAPPILAGVAGGPVAAGVVAGAQAAGDTYHKVEQERLRQGATPEQARRSGMKGAAIAGPIGGAAFAVNPGARLGTAGVTNAVAGGVDVLGRQLAGKVSAGIPFDSSEARNAMAAALGFGWAFQGLGELAASRGKTITPQQKQRIESSTPETVQQNVDAVRAEILADESVIDAANQGAPRPVNQMNVRGPRQQTPEGMVAVQDAYRPVDIPDPTPGEVAQRFEQSSPGFEQSVQQRREQADLEAENRDAEIGAEQIRRRDEMAQNVIIQPDQPGARPVPGEELPAQMIARQGRAQQTIAEAQPPQPLRSFPDGTMIFKTPEEAQARLDHENKYARVEGKPNYVMRKGMIPTIQPMDAEIGAKRAAWQSAPVVEAPRGPSPAPARPQAAAPAARQETSPVAAPGTVAPEAGPESPRMNVSSGDSVPARQPAGSGENQAAKQPWEMTREELADYEKVSASHRRESPSGYGMKQREAERERLLPAGPFAAPDLPLGTHAGKKRGPKASPGIYTLERFDINDPRVRSPEGSKPGKVSSTYAEWTKSGKTPPPLELVEDVEGNFTVFDGHHRLDALRAAGAKTFDAWVYKGSHRELVESALKEGRPVPPEVLADYPDLAPPPAAEPPKAAPVAKPPKSLPKIGDAAQIMGNDVIVADARRIEGTDYELFNANKMKDGRGFVRIFDVDSGEPVTIKTFPTYDAAEKFHREAVARAEGVPVKQPPQVRQSRAQVEVKQTPAKPEPVKTKPPIDSVKLKKVEASKKLRDEMRQLEGEREYVSFERIKRENEIKETPEAKKAVKAARAAVAPGKGRTGRMNDAEMAALQKLFDADPKIQSLKGQEEPLYAKIRPLDERIEAEKSSLREKAESALRQHFEQFTDEELGEFVTKNTQRRFDPYARQDRYEMSDEATIAQQVIDSEPRQAVRKAAAEKIAREKIEYEAMKEPLPGEVLPPGYKFGRGGVGYKPGPKYTAAPAKAVDKGYIPQSMVHEAAIAKRGETPPMHTTAHVQPDTPQAVMAERQGINVGRLKEFIKTVPEFELDPKFTVTQDGGLQFQDGGRFKYNSPGHLGIVVDEGALKPGETVGIDVEAVKKMKPNQAIALSAAAPSAGSKQAKGRGSSGAALMEPATGAAFLQTETPKTAETPPGTVKLHPLAVPEMVSLAKEMLGGKVPSVRRKMQALGYFKATTGVPETGRIEIRADQGADPKQLAGVLAHEIGHAVDFLPEGTLKRGNILGRVATLHSYLKGTLNTVVPPLKRLEIHKELIGVTEWWHGPIVGSDSQAKYRKSSKELYADAISVLLNSPGDLQERAPKFFRAFFDHADKKPEVRDAYFGLMDMLNGAPERVSTARREDIREMFGKGEEIWKARRAEIENGKQSWPNYLRQLLFDKSIPVLSMERRARGSKMIPWDEAMAAKHQLEELNMSRNPLHLWATDVHEQVTKPLETAGVDRVTAGEYLMMSRIAEGDRGGAGEAAQKLIMDATGTNTWPEAKEAYAKQLQDEGKNLAEDDLYQQAMSGKINPAGHTPKTARQYIADIEKRIGPEKFDALQKSMQKFHDLQWKIVGEAVDAGTYNREMVETVLTPNKNFYAPFAVLGYLDTKVKAGIFKQVGTFKDIANPFDASLMKTMSLIRLNEYQKAKREVIKLGQELGEIGQGQKIDKYHRERPAGQGKENLILLEDGKPFAYEVDDYIARVFQSHDIGSLRRVSKLFASQYKVFHPLWITLNTGWQAMNIPRDIQRTYINSTVLRHKNGTLGQMVGALADIPKVAAAYKRAVPAAWRRAMDKNDPLIRQMLEDRALNTPFVKSDPFDDAMQYDRILQEAGVWNDQQKRRGLLRGLGKVYDGMEVFGTFLETLPKVAMFDMATKAGYAGRERAYIVRNYAGTPNTARKGLTADLHNSVWTYSNVILQGLRADAEVAAHPKTLAGRWMRAALANYLPKTAMLAAAGGLYGAYMKDFMDDVPEYDKTKYIILPLGRDRETKKPIYMRLPHNDTDRLLAAAFWKVMSKKPATSFGEVVDLASGETPGLNPYFTMASKWGQFLAGRNPHDDFRNREIIGRDEQLVGGAHRWKPMLLWTTDQFGEPGKYVRIMAEWNKDPQGKTKGTTEKLIGPLPMVSRMVRVSDRGSTERAWDAVREEDRSNAEFRLSMPENARKMNEERYRLNRLGDERLTPAQKDRRVKVNEWYSKTYKKTRDDIEAAEAKGNKSEATRLRRQLQTATDPAK